MLTRMIGEDVDLVMVPSPNLWPVRADAGQIEQVIMNLAVNARDAMPSGGKLTIETSNVTLDEDYARFHAPLRPGDYVMIAISDTGAGMDTETQSHIFEPFFTTKGTKGTGLGLSTVYGIVKQSGGYIWVYSEVGRGTTFKIYLPRVASIGEMAAETAAGKPWRRLAAPIDNRKVEPGTETILLVEDEANLRYLARQYLEKQGYKVIEAADGAVAMQIAVAHEKVIHLLLTDVIMPGMNGRELAQRIAEIRPNVKILYMSGYTENVIGHNGMLDAGIRLLQKPFNLRDLKSMVREVLDTIPTPPEVVMNTQSADTTPRRAPAGNSSHSRPTIPTSLAAALSPSRRERLARRHHRKHQPLRHALRGRRSPAAQRATGNQSRAPAGNRGPVGHGSSLPRRSRPHRRTPRRHSNPRAGRAHPAIPLPARPAPQGVSRKRTDSQRDSSVADDATPRRPSGRLFLSARKRKQGKKAPEARPKIARRFNAG